MKLTFLGTRGEIEARTRRHRMHTSLLVSYRSADVMIDCGLDWLGKLKRVDPSAIVFTQAHRDAPYLFRCEWPPVTMRARKKRSTSAESLSE